MMLVVPPLGIGDEGFRSEIDLYFALSGEKRRSWRGRRIL